ncbi:alpha/beta hydrolase [Xanthomonas sacchari]|uniref:Alpha/beta hydrolase n=1 Tax=Xanthomonas sacchari TaxID=56458 RepID=A0A2P5Z3Y3_9XANT|nr:alpha/beta hydrolase [Xanthomonas sacchari]MDV0438531.1 alpha/beta fold hydrolase [Xanthomonas sacchari]PPU82463.1 alpha/beta hydrolase [Xanthomonas sacchari]
MHSHSRDDIAFDADGVTLRGWLYRPMPTTAAPAPIVVMAHGWSLVKEAYLDRYAEVFAAAGLAVLVYDHRGFGDSDGTPRQEIDPWRQIEDCRHAITYAGSLDGVDPTRIGVWGTSYSGAHAMQVAATDRRVKAVVAQVPGLAGYRNGLRRGSYERAEALQAAFAADRLAVLRGAEPARKAVIGAADALFPSDDARAFFEGAGAIAPNWRNWTTLRSAEWSRGYEPACFAAAISPTPLLMIVADRDYISGTDFQLQAYAQALEPKQLLMLRGGHFVPYVEQFEASSGAARDWFVAHLAATPAPAT